jgi:hypothetical protein
MDLVDLYWKIVALYIYYLLLVESSHQRIHPCFLFRRTPLFRVFPRLCSRTRPPLDHVLPICYISVILLDIDVSYQSQHFALS